MAAAKTTRIPISPMGPREAQVGIVAGHLDRAPRPDPGLVIEIVTVTGAASTAVARDMETKSEIETEIALVVILYRAPTWREEGYDRL